MNTASESSVRIVNPQGLLPKGISDFDKIVQQRRCFVDKSLFIQEMLHCDDDVILITRPRRFGKTTNQSMLQAFFEKPAEGANTSRLFDGLLVSGQADIMKHQGRYPVISLTFKDVKAASWSQAYDKLCELMYEEIQRHAEALNFQAVDLFARTHGIRWSRILQQRQATLNDWEAALKLLCKLLTLYHNQGKPQQEWVRPIVLLDEYDAPIHSAYAHSDKKLLVRAAGQSQDEWQQAFDSTYYGKMVRFMRNLLSGALKDNDRYLHKAVITGILRVAKEDIFSGLNNLGTYGVLKARFRTQFGFTQAEVQQLFVERRLQQHLPSVQRWYDGYRFGQKELVTKVYNPWSIASFVADEARALDAYWANTSGNELIHTLINSSSLPDKQNMERLLLGQTVQKKVSETLALRELHGLPDALYSILLCSGYLTPQETHVGSASSSQAKLRIPNEEVRTIYQDLVTRWFGHGQTNPLPTVLNSLAHGDLAAFAAHLGKLADVTLSYFDVAQQPEWFYHALVLGMVAYMSDTHFVRSNAESGEGRPDILLIPRDDTPLKPGIVLEIKQADSPNHLETAARQGLQQIDVKRYAAVFHDHPTSELFVVAIAFHNKQAAVQYKQINLV